MDYMASFATDSEHFATHHR